MFLLFFMLFTIVPALELYLLFTVGAKFGALNTILIIIVTGILGASLARTQGLAVLHKIQSQLNSGQLPTNEFIHGFLVFGGGLLLLTPGFLTDIIGFSAVIPGSRHLIAIYLKKFFTSSIAKGNMQFTSFGQNSQGFHFYSSQSSFNPETENVFNHQDHQEQVDDGFINAEFTHKNED